MSILESLRPKAGSTHNSKRLGRGRGSGKGGRAGKGNKGQKARKSGQIRRGFEGGQTPIHRRTPKVGFSNTKFRNRPEIVNLKSLEALKGEITPAAMKASGLIHGDLVKVLGNHKLSKAIKVTAHFFSETAKNSIMSAGGSVEVIK